MDYTYKDIAKMIDHSLLNPCLTDKELERGCYLAVEYDCASVCIMPYYLKRCAEILRGSTVKPSTTIAFPHGGHATATEVHSVGIGPGGTPGGLDRERDLLGLGCQVEQLEQGVVYDRSPAEDRAGAQLVLARFLEVHPRSVGCVGDVHYDRRVRFEGKRARA